MRGGESRTSSEAAASSFLQSGLEQLPLTVSSSQREQLIDLAMLLDAWAGRINLTGHRDPASIVQGLILDAAGLASVLPELMAAGRVADLGTGAGFPGIPLAILFPEVEFLLVDSRKKRHHFQREARRRLGLERVRPLLGRSDELEHVQCDIVVAQAMAQPDRALTLMAQWSRPGGCLALPASESGTRPEPPHGFDAGELRRYDVPPAGQQRQLWVLHAKR